MHKYWLVTHDDKRLEITKWEIETRTTKRRKENFPLFFRSLAVISFGVNGRRVDQTKRYQQVAFPYEFLKIISISMLIHIIRARSNFFLCNKPSKSNRVMRSICLNGLSSSSLVFHGKCISTATGKAASISSSVQKDNISLTFINK